MRLLLLLALVPLLLAAQPTAPRDYPTLVAEAKSLAAENSWEQARERYTEALAIAPATDPDARHWLELWILDATWRSEISTRWQRAPNWSDTLLARFDQLSAPYDNPKHPRARDDLWIALLTSRADFTAQLGLGESWKLRATVADHLAAQPPSPESARRYLEFLQQSLTESSPTHHAEFASFRPHLVHATRIAPGASGRAWAAWQLARTFSSPRLSTDRPDLREQASLWSAALDSSANTDWAPFIRAEALLWRIRSRWSPDAAPNSPADIPALLAELHTARDQLPAQPAALVYALSTQLRSFHDTLSGPTLLVQLPTLLTPDAPVRFSFGAAGLDALHVTLDRLSPEDWISLNLPDSPGPRRPGDIARPTPAKRLRDWSIPLNNASSLAWNSQVVEALPSLAPGAYLLTLEGRSPRSGETTIWQGRFLVSSLRGFVQLSSTTSGQLFAFHAADGSPAIHAPVQLFTRLRDQPVARTQTTTDASGSAVLPQLDPSSNGTLALVADQPLWFSYYSLYRDHSENLFVDVVTDRPLYRPGETARWRLVARERHHDRFVIPANLPPLRYRVMLDDTTLVDSTPLTLGTHGTAHGEIAIPADVRPGHAHLDLFFENDSPDRAQSSTALFQIDRFVPPAVLANISLLSDPDALRPGREIAVRVEASYFSGGPLTHAPVTCQFSVDDFLPTTDETFAAWSRSLAARPLHATTNASGHADFTLTLPAFLPDQTRLGVHAAVNPVGAASANADTTLTLSDTGLTLDPLGWTAPRLARAGETISVSAVVRDGQNRPARFDGHAQLLELRWSEVWIDDHGAIIPPERLAAEWQRSGSATQRVPDTWRLVHAGYLETVVSEHPLPSADGRLETSFELPHPGAFRIRFVTDQEIFPTVHRLWHRRSLFNSQRRDRPGDLLLDSRREVLSVVAADTLPTSLALNPETSALILPAQARSDQPLLALGIAPAGASRAWFTLRGAARFVTHPAALHDRVSLHTFENLPPLFGSATVEFHHTSAAASHQATVTASIPVSTTPHRLQTSVTATPDEQRPGQPAQLLVTTQTPSGQPAANVELTLAVADDAVLSLVASDSANSIDFLGTSDSANTADPLDANLPDFLRTSQIVAAQSFWSAGTTDAPTRFTDPRPGAILNPSGEIDDDVIILSPFAVNSAAETGYRASQSLAAARTKTVLRDQATATTALGNIAPSAEPPTLHLRTRFASTAFWSPSVLTDARGEARVSFDFPDNLTRWRIDAHATGPDGNTFGAAHTYARTSLPFQARLNLPRFLIAGDTASPSATLVNRTDNPLSADAILAISGPLEPTSPLAPQTTSVAPNSESSAAWSLRATAPGTAQLTLTARAGAESDAMQLPLPVLEDGIQQHTAAFARLAPDTRETSFTLALPSPLDPARSHVSIQLSPHLALTILDALPYLIDFPYGCVEQTMSRFLPAVVVRETLADLGLDPAAVEQRILARESAADRTRRERSAGLASLDDVIRQSLARLDEAHQWQGYGWWPDASPDLWMTAYVSWGLSLAVDAGIQIPDTLAEKTHRSLVHALNASTRSDDSAAFALAALARVEDLENFTPLSQLQSRFAAAFPERDRLSASGRAWLTLAVTRFGTPDQSATLVRNLSNGVQRASAAGLGSTAFWGATRNYWRASEGAVESTAVTLLALLATDPQNPLVQPAAHWLALNRRSSHWSSTRDTALAILALNTFLQHHGHLDASGEIELLANNTPIRRLAFSRDTLLENPAAIDIPATALRPGENTFTLRHLSGRNPVLATALASSWARGDSVQPAAHLIETSRTFERQKSEPTLIGELRLTPEPLAPHGSTRVTEEVTARITLTVPNELEYLMIEVPKPAGCEPLNPLSGWDARLVRLPADQHENPSSSSGRSLYREEHDNRSVFFLDHVEAGTWELRFGLRAVTPGDFRALPVTATAMYVPEITANSDSRRLKIER